MAIPLRHVLDQGPVLRALGSVAVASLRGARNGQASPPVPGPWEEVELAPRPGALVRDFIRNAGGDPAWYRGRVPPHLFPQWSFALVTRALAATSYPLARAVNAGCRMEIRAPIPEGEQLQVRVRLDRIEDDGKKALVTQRVITGTASAPEALVAEMRVFVPLAKAEKRSGRLPAVVPSDAREIAFMRIGAKAGLDFAKLTGDFNPIHWVPAYARAAGFGSVILHGFATLARAIEALNRSVFSGDPSRLATVDVRFTRPLVLPARVGVYVSDRGGLYVGAAPGGGANLEGTFEARVELDEPGPRRPPK